MSQPYDLIAGALLDIGAREAGEVAGPDDTSEAFTLMKQMLDSWWNEPQMLFCKNEIIHELVNSTYVYTIGNGGDIVATFIGSITGNVLTVTSLATGALSVGMLVTGAGIATGTTITSLDTGRGGNTTAALGTYRVNVSQTSGVIVGIAYAVRPLKINSAFVRVSNSVSGTLDYPVAVLNVEKYELIGIKTLPGPWPRAVYYQPSEPLGVLTYWPNPSDGEMHLFCDPVPTQYASINDQMMLPQGFDLAIRSNLAALLLPSYGKKDASQIQMIMETARKSRAVIKRTNMQPLQTANFDAILVPGRVNNSGFILDGGFG